MSNTSLKEDQRSKKDESESVERYFKVRFQAKSNVNDTEDVMLAVNGETLVIRRESEVIVPERFLLCADNAVYQHFRQLPGKPRKVVGQIKMYPYDKLGEASEKEYLKQKSDGTRATRDAIRKYGFDSGDE
jgi:hypothetical protein